MKETKENERKETERTNEIKIERNEGERARKKVGVICRVYNDYTLNVSSCNQVFSAVLTYSA
jgi:hypothetical protein